MISLDSEHNKKQHEAHIESQRKYRLSHKEQILKREKESLRYISKKVDPKLKHAHYSETAKKCWANPISRTKLMFDRQNRKPETFKKISETVKNLWADPKYHEKQMQNRQEHNEKISGALKKVWSNPTQREKRLESFSHPDFLSKMSRIVQNRWNNVDSRRILLECKSHSNRSESKAHHNLKKAVGNILVKQGFSVQYEHPLCEGKPFYIIDVYGEKAQMEVLVEIGRCEIEKREYLSATFPYFYHVPYGGNIGVLQEIQPI